MAVKDLNSKVDVSTYTSKVNELQNSINTKATKDVATTSANGLMSSADKTKLDGIATGANKYTHPTTAGNKHIPSGGASGQFLKWSADGTAVWANDNNTTYTAGTGLSLSGTTFSANIGTGSSQVAAGNHTHNYLPLSGGTLSGNITVKNNSFISESVGNSTATFAATGDHVYIANNTANKYLQIYNDGTLRYSGLKIYHEGNRPSASDVGARDNAYPQITNWFNGTPIIQGDGVMDIGKYIDFHHTKNSSSDYDVRLEASTDGLFISNNFLPSAHNTQNLGSITSKWNECWANYVNTGFINSPGGDLRITANDDGSSIYIGAQMVPTIDNHKRLGSSTHRWQAIFSVNGALQTSDARHKSIIDTIDTKECFDMIKNTNVYSYTMIGKDITKMTEKEIKSAEKEVENENIQMGILAQDLLPYECSKYILTQNLETDSEGNVSDTYAINPYNFASAIMAALKEEISKREELQNEVKELKELIKNS